jgi:hypothetical protein
MVVVGVNDILRMSHIKFQIFKSLHLLCDRIKKDQTGGENIQLKISSLAFFILFSAVAVFAIEDRGEKPDDWQQKLEMLRSVPYLASSETAVDQNAVGVLYHDAEKSHQGYNFYSTLSSGEAYLMDMDGRIVHRWIYPHHQRERGTDHAILLENGDVIILKEHREVVRLDWNSRLLWRKSLLAHHDVSPAPDGSFYAILRHMKPHRGLKVFFPGIAHITGDGEPIDRWSAFDDLESMKDVLDTRSFLDSILDNMTADRVSPSRPVGRKRPLPQARIQKYDYFHMNAINVIGADMTARMGAPFRRGNLLVCFRNVNQVAVLEQGTYRLLWAWGEGELQWPHHPTLLDNGHILIFDNGVRRGYSRIVELDPATGDIVWQYISDPPGDFFSHTRGSAQRLPNGNTLVCESDKGAAFEVTASGEVVWRWQNPDLVEPLWSSLDPTAQGNGGLRYSKAVYRMVRWPAEMVEPLLARWWWE